MAPARTVRTFDNLDIVLARGQGVLAGESLERREFRVSSLRYPWVMVGVSHDDLMRLRTDHGSANIAIIRHTALNLIRAIKDEAGLKVR